MYLIDTHTHLYEEQFDDDRADMIQRALENGVSKMIIPNVDSTTIQPMLDIVQQFPNAVFPMIGLHPCYVKPATYQQELAIIRNYLHSNEHQFVAVGEIGIDLYWDKSTLDIQKEAFEIQCDFALEKNIAIAIHSRDATHILIDILKKRKRNPKGVFHCFTGSVEEAKEILKLGLFLGIGGVVTYKNTHLRDTLQQLPLDRIVLETDAPYLPPVPYRGKRNESAYTKIVAETLCSVYQKKIDEIASVTTQNATALFGI
ncbi:MAG TPA: TatD family hydrolase [Chitinophagales bacterium]|nr:TatD family hydrolase [Chitinophagales bacterium]HNN25847.1 TatD family hydrolase [Chitinophagales bacterium]